MVNLRFWWIFCSYDIQWLARLLLWYCKYDTGNAWIAFLIVFSFSWAPPPNSHREFEILILLNLADEADERERLYQVRAQKSIFVDEVSPIQLMILQLLNCSIFLTVNSSFLLSAELRTCPFLMKKQLVA